MLSKVGNHVVAWFLVENNSIFMFISLLALVGTFLSQGTPPALAMGPMQEETAIVQEKRVIEEMEKSERVVKTMKDVTMTAYSSTPDQTDDTPFTMANGKHVYDGAVAANFLPFGTKVRFPDLYGDKVFVVEDRMNKRFNNRMDIWMETRQEAMNFGIKAVTIEVLAENS